MLYFIKDSFTQAIKIGYSKKPQKRLSGLQTANCHKLILLGTIRGTPADEDDFHRRFAQHRMEGEWFKGEIIEEVLEIISSHKQLRLEMRRKTMTDSINREADGGGDVPLDLAVNEKDVLDKDSGVIGICRIPGLRMKSLSMKLTERACEEAHSGGQVYCGVEIKYVLEFEKDFSSNDPTGQNFFESERAKLRQALFSHDKGLPYTFYDEDNAVIPFKPSGAPSLIGPGPNDWFNSIHIVGGQEAVTGVKGDAFRVLVAFERRLDPKHHNAKIQNVFMGENYTGEHPLKRARKFMVTCPLPKDQSPTEEMAKGEAVLRKRATCPGQRIEIPIPEGWFYWTHLATGMTSEGKEEVIRDGQGRVMAVATEIPRGIADLSVTIRRKQE